jgi:hypothetical protein
MRYKKASSSLQSRLKDSGIDVSHQQQPKTHVALSSLDRLKESPELQAKLKGLNETMLNHEVRYCVKSSTSKYPEGQERVGTVIMIRPTTLNEETKILEENLRIGRKAPVAEFMVQVLWKFDPLSKRRNYKTLNPIDAVEVI